MRCLIFSLLLATSLAAQDRRDVAVFFPVAEYSGDWQPLPGAIPECRNIAADLEQLYGFNTEVLPNLTKTGIEDKLAELAARRYGPQDQLLLFFSMHGHFDEAGDGGCLVPYKGLGDDPTARSWLLHTTLRYLVSRIPCEHVLLVLDACYSGTFGGAKSRPDAAAGSDCQTRLQNALSRKSRLYLTAGGKEKVPADSDFARRWRSALGGRGGSDGLLTFPELQAQLSEATPTPKWGSFSGDLGGGFVFVLKEGCDAGANAATSTPAPRDADLAAIETARRQNTEADWQFYLDSWPKGRYRAEAQQGLYRLQEDRVWQTASRLNTPAAYQNYQSIYCPGGRYCTEAAQRASAPAPATSLAIEDNPADPMALIRGGSFQMGSTDGAPDEQPVHTVTLSDFYIAKQEVTVAEFKAFIDATGYKTDAEKEGLSRIYRGNVWVEQTGINWKCDARGNLRPSGEYNHPVLHVSWNDAMAYCRWLSKKTGLSYRLPTEAEWEYAAGNGSAHTRWAGTDKDSELLRFTNSSGNQDGFVYTAPAGNFQPNVFGLRNMSGNVWEWCSDWGGSYSSKAQNDPVGPLSGSARIIRGGSWQFSAAQCRVTARLSNGPSHRSGDIGFRVAASRTQ